MSRTLSTSSSSGITLTNAGTANNPFTVAVTGKITPVTGDALIAVGKATYNWTIDNFGTIASTPSSTHGIYLGPGTGIASGTITNESGGRISSGGYGIVINGPGFVTNSAGGTISALNFKAIYLIDTGTVVNSGVIASGNGTVGNVAIYEANGGVITNQSGGTITGQGGVWFEAPGTFTNFGVVIGSNAGFGAILFNATSAPNRFIDEPGGTVTGNIIAQIGGTDVIELASAASTGTLSGIGTSITNFDTLQFDSGSKWIVSGVTATGTVPGFNSIAIQGFAFGDTIDLKGFAATSYSFASNALVLTNAATAHSTLHIQGTFATSDFHIASDGTGGTFITDITPCYLAGTRIRTDRGEIAVEDLRIGDRVVTLSGEAKPIKWIGRRSFASAFAAGNRDVIPILIKAGALGDGVPARDLYVSPLHAMFFDDVLIQAEHLVNGVSVVRCSDIDPIRYFHIELDQHDVIFAEGAPAETFVDCDSRAMFHNAADFARLYPAGDTAKWQFCAPRIESGPILDQVKRTIDALAGLGRHRERTGPGPLQGQLDGLEGATITGWAFDPANPDNPVVLDVLDGDGLIARVTANRFRGDLEAAGIGNGRHGFELRLTRGLSPATRHEIRLRRVSDGRELTGSPLVVEPHSDRATLKDACGALDAAIAAAGDAAALDAVLNGLLQRVGTVCRLHAGLTAPPRGNDPLLSWAKTGRARAKRALLIDDRLPRRDRDAGSNAVLGHIAALRSLGWEVELVASHELACVDGADTALRALGVRCHLAPRIASVEEVLRYNRNQFELVYLHRLSNAEAYAPMVRIWQPRARVLYSVADLHHIRVARQAAVQDNPEQRESSVRLKARELAAMRLVDAVITHSPEEAGYLAAEAPGANVHIVPWALTAQRRAVPLRERADIAFIGGYRHAPNADAVRWLNDAVMPLVWARDPAIVCRVVGPDWPEMLAGSMDRRMQFTGQVQRLEDVFDTVRLTVAPLRFGAGLKGKVLDSLAAGVPCAMTPVAAEGLPLSRPLRGLVADGVQTLADAILDYYHRSGLNRSCADAGLAMVGEHYNEAAVRAAMAAAVGMDAAAPVGRTMEGTRSAA